MTDAEEKMAAYRLARHDPRVNAHEKARLWADAVAAAERESEAKAQLAKQEDEQ